MIAKNKEQLIILGLNTASNYVRVLRVMEVVIMIAITLQPVPLAMEQAKSATKAIKLLLHKD